jgi:hypothetical protein
VQLGRQRREREEHRPEQRDPAQQHALLDPAADACKAQRHSHADQGAGRDVPSDEHGTACIEGIHHERDLARKLTDDRSAPAQLYPAHIMKPKHSADGSQSTRPRGFIHHVTGTLPNQSAARGATRAAAAGGRQAAVLPAVLTLPRHDWPAHMQNVKWLKNAQNVY